MSLSVVVLVPLPAARAKTAHTDPKPTYVHLLLPPLVPLLSPTHTEYMPYFLKLFVDAALLQLDAPSLRGMRPKRRVLLVRFLAKAMLCPYYRYRREVGVPESVCLCVLG